MLKSTSLRLSPALVPFLLLATSCGGGSGGGSTTPAGSNLQTLSGLVLAPSGVGLPGVTINAQMASATSNADGLFVLTAVTPFNTDDLLIQYDGRTAGVQGQYPALAIHVDLPDDQESATVPQVITLPDLMSPESASQTVAADPGGVASEAIDVMGNRPDLALEGPAGTVVTIGGQPADGMIDFNVTPVDPGQVPMLLPDDLLGGGFVTIQPGEGAFDPPGPAQGLDVTLPNGQGLAVGEQVDIWSFDHSVGAWVNRSEETNQRGVVVDMGAGETAVQANGVITEGGWHAAAAPVDPNCATTFRIRATDTSSGLGVPGVLVQLLNSGQVGFSDANGLVEIPLVAAYDAAELAASGNCVPTEIRYFALFPQSVGFKQSGIQIVPFTDVVPGGVTDAGEVACDVPTEGTLSGIVFGQGETANEPVRLLMGGVEIASVVPNSGGAFFFTNVEAGDYVVTFDCAGAEPLSETSVTVSPGQVTTITIGCDVGTGTGDVNVRVYLDQRLGDGLPGMPQPFAVVTLQGTDPGSQGGLSAMADEFGVATFNDVNGPFTVTASADIELIPGGSGDDLVRVVHSVIGVNPTAGELGIVLERDDVFTQIVPSTTPATVAGTMTNLPALAFGQSYSLQFTAVGLDGSIFRQASTLDPDGDFAANLPAGVPIDVAVTRFDLERPMTTTLLLNRGPFSEGLNLNSDIDFNSGSSVNWNQSVAVNISNLPTSADLDDFFVGLSLSPAVGRVPFEIGFEGPGAETFDMDLPAIGSGALAGFGAHFLVRDTQATSFFLQLSENGCIIPLTSTPATLSASLPDAPSLTTPAPLSQLPGGLVAGTAFAWDLPGASSGPGGLEQLRLSGVTQNAAGTGSIFTNWQLTVPRGQALLLLPATGLTTFDVGQNLFVRPSTVRFEGSTLSFDALFAGDADDRVEQAFGTSTSACRAGETTFLFVQAPL